MQQLPISNDDKPAGENSLHELLMIQRPLDSILQLLHVFGDSFDAFLLYRRSSLYYQPMMGLLLCLMFPIFYGISSLV